MINTLPQSLIETAETMLRNRLLNDGGACVLNDGWSIHHECDNGYIHPLLHTLIESVDDFHDWVNETEHTPTKLHIKSYIQHGIPSDDAQMNQRIITPSSHPELYQHMMGLLSPVHQNTINSYSVIGLRHGYYPSGSYRINKFLIDANAAHMKPNSEIRHHPYGEVFNINHMDSALNNTTLPHPLTTYSGVGFDPREIINKDGVFNSPAYMSSSTRRFVAGKYAIQSGNNDHHILQINNHVGDNGVYVGNRTQLSPFSDDEYILPRHIRMKVDPTPKTFNSSGHNFHIWNTHRLDREYND